jgi:hypothetical protein
VNHPQIAAFARLATENTPAARSIEGQKTLISRTMHGFAYDPIHDEIVVTSPLAQAILVFRGAANGEEAPIRVIQGPHTQILGTAYCGNDKVSIDPVNDEILLPLASGQAGCGGGDANGLLVFARDANGDAAPKRILRGTDTQINSPSPVAVDPVHNLLFVSTNRAMLVFDRTASGNVKPKAVITGPKSEMASTNTFQIYPEKGWIINGCTNGAICAWNINDNGDVPPRWKIPVQQLTGYTASGIVLDPVHKEMILSAAGQRVRPTPNTIMNTILTFSWPEIF